LFLAFTLINEMNESMRTNKIGEIMKETCENCEYFVAKGISYSSSPRWGDCMKPTGFNSNVDVEKQCGVFMWNDKTCDDFKPKQR